MKVPFAEVTEILQLQTPPGKPSEESKLLWELHCQGTLMAVSHGCQVAILRVADTAPPVLICAPSHRITALCWLCNVVPPFQKREGNPDALTTHVLLGNEKGEFMVYDVTGELILRQKFHAGPVLRIKARAASMGLEGESIEDVSVVFSDVLCCIPLPELLAFIRLHEAGSGQCQDPTLRLAHGKFGFGKSHSNRTDGLHLGLQIPSVKHHLDRHDNDTEETKINILTVGRSPAVGMFEATVTGGKQGALALIGKFASSMTLGISALAWKNGKKVLKRGVRSWWSNSKEDDVLPADPATLQYSLRDNKRQVQSLIPAPQDCLAVACDSLGRVMLIDTQKSIVLRIWKGYRDAQCAWITQPSPQRDGSLQLYLVVYGWRREALEVWPMRYGQRMFSLHIGPNCRLMPSAPPMGLGESRDWKVKCGVLDFESEELWDVGEKAFPPKSGEVKAIWDMMLTT